MNLKCLAFLVLTASVSALSGKEASDKLGSPCVARVPYKYEHPLMLSSGFVPSLMTNQAISDWNVSLEKASAWVFDKGHDWLQPDKVWTRVAYKYLIYPIFMGPFYKSMRYSQHMYGEASRLEAFGYDVKYVNNQYETYAENYWTLFLKNTYKSYLSIFGGGLPSLSVVDSKKDRKGIQDSIKALRENDAVDSDSVWLNAQVAQLRNDLEADLTHSQRLLLRAGGYNARMMHTRNVEDTLWYDRGGHLAQLSNHSANKLIHTIDAIGTFFKRNESGQANSDLGRIQAAYKDLGIDVSWKEMGAYGAIAFLGSAEFWGRFFEEVDYISTGDVFIQAPERYGFRLPNLGFYLTSKGPSYMVNTGYRYGESLFFPVALELVFKGDKCLETTVGVRKKLSWMNSYVHGEGVLNVPNFAVGAKVGVGVKPSDRWFLDAWVRIDNAKTLEGERNIKEHKNEDSNISVSFALSGGILF